MKLRPSVKEAMRQLHVKKLKKNLIKPINAILDGHDALVIAPMSYGRSLLYQIPAVVQKDAMTIVVEPSPALIHDQVQKLQKHGIPAACLDSAQSESNRNDVINAMHSGEVQILYLASEQLRIDILSWIEESNKIGIIVVDECHCAASWGQIFRDAYLAIGKYIDQMKQHPVVVALSAAILPEDRPNIITRLSMRNVKTFRMSLYQSNLRFVKRMTPSRMAQLKELKRCLKKYRKHMSIVVCSTEEHAEGVAGELRKKYQDDVILYHGQDNRQEKATLSDRRHIIVAASALSTGVDVRNVDLVIHYNMPVSLADYYQMASRAGCEGQEARSILLYNPDDYNTNRALLHDIGDKAVRKAMLASLNEMKRFCEDEKHCMVRTMLQALGDSYDHNCRYCTNCQRRK